MRNDGSSEYELLIEINVNINKFVYSVLFKSKLL